MPNRCVDCQTSPRVNDSGSCYSETFPVKAPNGVQVLLTLRLCLSCGARFQDRPALRAYLQTRLPVHATAVAFA
ncbi:MAG TPA: hypothetical protein VLU43_18590 [Anaeromyxobacteraceae bacterium]|nr:hypothetical protein [Anaeromyxobacteraceae bacterium]